MTSQKLVSPINLSCYRVTKEKCAAYVFSNGKISPTGLLQEVQGFMIVERYRCALYCRKPRPKFKLRCADSNITKRPLVPFDKYKRRKRVHFLQIMQNDDKNSSILICTTKNNQFKVNVCMFTSMILTLDVTIGS